ncbi:carbohydrate sulfotransferase 1-like isoform X2 [Amphibalanus amphitrite]|nr:carbohydrate sulfotransferase 1-like isoform X2 [Amphibalanus amphitrite]
MSVDLPGQKTFYGVPADESSVVQDGWRPHPIIPPSVTRPRLVVVVSSAPRSGSSFLGQLMSSPRGALYFFEPFWFYKHLNNNKTAAPYNYTAASDLYNLFTCNLDALPPMFAERSHRGFIWRKPRVLKRDPTRAHLTSLCLSTSIRVIKTIRPRLANVLPLLERTDLDVRIIHLVRDPRAIHNSLVSRGHAWPQRRRNATLLCEDIRDDLRASQSINSDRWTGVRYEDLVERPAEEARRLFEFLQLPLAKETLEFIRTHARSRDAPKSPDPVGTSTKRDTVQAAGNRGQDVADETKAEETQAVVQEDNNRSQNQIATAEDKPSALTEADQHDHLRNTVKGIAEGRDRISEAVNSIFAAMGGSTDDNGSPGSGRFARRLHRSNVSGHIRPDARNTIAGATRRRRDTAPVRTHRGTPRRLLTIGDEDEPIQQKPKPKTRGGRAPTFRRLTRNEYVRALKRREIFKKKKKKGPAYYFATVRGAEFDRLHWIRELPPAERSNVENVCEDVLASLGYPLRYPEENDGL